MVEKELGERNFGFDNRDFRLIRDGPETSENARQSLRFIMSPGGAHSFWP